MEERRATVFKRFAASARVLRGAGGMLTVTVCSALLIGTATAAGGLSKTDLNFLSWAAQIEVQQQDMGRLALRRGQTAAVRDLGTYLLEAHRQAEINLKKLADRLDVHLSTKLSVTHLNVQHHYGTVPVGLFDRAFIRHEVGDYRYFLRHFEAATASQNFAVRQYAQEQIAKLRDGQAWVRGVVGSLR